MLKKILIAVSLCLACHNVYAQVVPATQGGGRRLQIGIGGSGYQTDWNRHEYGLAFYADYDIFHHIGIEAETRFIFINKADFGPIHLVGEKNFGIGPRIAFTRGRFIPYAKALAGISSINWGHGLFVDAPNYTGDHYVYLGVGAGTDYKLTRHIRLRGEFQYQFWKNDPGGKNSIIYTPHGVTVGAAYRF